MLVPLIMAIGASLSVPLLLASGAKTVTLLRYIGHIDVAGGIQRDPGWSVRSVLSPVMVASGAASPVLPAEYTNTLSALS